MASSRSRLTWIVLSLLVLIGAGGACWIGAGAAANYLESHARRDVSQAMMLNGHDWVEVAADGLRVTLSGTAPGEVERFRAVTDAATQVDLSRIVDQMTVASSATLAPPEFKVELLRNDDGISMIGLVPAALDRVALTRQLKSETAAPRVTDLLESAAYPVPEHWPEALRFGLMAAQMAQQAKISIRPGAVSVSALADSAAEKGRLEGDLRRALPGGVTLSTDISAPRPVIAPFTLRFVMDDQGPRFDACAADSEAGRSRILQAAAEAGVSGQPPCTVGLGAPTPDWADAAAPAIRTVAELGGGTVTISDADITLIAPPDTPRDRFDSAVAAFEGGLPAVFSLQAQIAQADDADRGPAGFAATLSADGKVTLRGRIADERMRDAVDSIARSRFARIEGGMRADPNVPEGWTVRVIAALEAMAALHSGHVTVTPDMLQLAGTSGDAQATGKAAAILSERLGPGAAYELSIRYDRHLDPSLALPDGNECVARLNLIMSEAEIGFEPNKSAIAGDPGPTLDRLASAMMDCGEYQIEAAGHTDAQGSEGFNADLSRARAQALVQAMRDAGIDTTNMTSRGYGESQPIAPNDTDAGREANRRIEFRLLSELPVRSEPLPAPVVISGVTGQTPVQDAADVPQAAVTAAQAIVMAPPATTPPALPAEDPGRVAALTAQRVVTGRSPAVPAQDDAMPDKAVSGDPAPGDPAPGDPAPGDPAPGGRADATGTTPLPASAQLNLAATGSPRPTMPETALSVATRSALDVVGALPQPARVAGPTAPATLGVSENLSRENLTAQPAAAAAPTLSPEQAARRPAPRPRDLDPDPALPTPDAEAPDQTE